MAGDVLSTYVNQATEVENIGFDSQLLMDLILQGVNTIILIVLVVFIIRLCILGIKALKIYIRKNNQ